MASVSLPNIEYGRSSTQELNGSRMSAGFADVSQLADEEKEKLDILIEKLEEERRRMMATTQLLTAAQSPKQIEQSPKEKEKDRLQTELKDIRSYNRDLEKELIELRACLHPGSPPRSSTPQTQHALTDHPQFTPRAITHTPDLTRDSSYYTPQNTTPKQAFGEFYSPAHTQYNTPPSGQISPHESPQIVPHHYTESATPHFERLKSGESPVFRHPSHNSHEMQGFSPRASRMPMRVPRDSHRSLGNSPIPLQQTSPVEFRERSYRSVGNSPRTDEPDYGGFPKVGQWGSQKVLPSSPNVRMYQHAPETRTHPQGGARWQLSDLSQRGRSPTNFYRKSSKNMNGHRKNEFESENSSTSDISRKSEPRYHGMPEGRHSSDDRSIKAPRRGSKSIQDAYQRHLEASKSASEASILSESQQSFFESSDIGHGVTPKPRQRQKRSVTPQRLVHTSDSKTYESDSLSDNSSKRGKKRSTKITKNEKPSSSRSNSRQSSKDRKPTPKKRIHTTADVHRSSDPLKTPIDSFESTKQRPRVSISSTQSRDSRSKRHSAPKEPIHYDDHDQSKSRVNGKTRPKSAKQHPQVSTNSTRSPDIPKGSINRDSDRSKSSVDDRTHPKSPKQRPQVSSNRTRSPDSQSRLNYRDSDQSESSVDSRKRLKSKEKSGDRHSQFSRADTQGSFAPPRQVTSHENLAGSHPGSVDSLDTLHGGGSNPSMGVYGTSKSGTTTPDLDSPRRLDHKYQNIAEFDPYANIHSSDHNLTDKSLPESEKGPEITHKQQKSKRPSSKVTQPNVEPTHENANFVKSTSTQSTASDISRHADIHTHSQLEPQQILKPTQSSLHSSTTHSTKSNSGSDLDASPIYGTSFKSQKPPIHLASVKNEMPIHNAKELTNKESSSEWRRPRKIPTSDGDSSYSRTTPEGDAETKSVHSSSEYSFSSPEEEMKFLVSRLQGIMPSIHDQPMTDSRSSIDLKEVKPMSEVLLAAQQTRQSIRLFAEYAIAVAAGEV